MKKNRLTRSRQLFRQCAKLFLLMKLSIIFVLLACLQASAKGYSQDVKLTLNLSQVPIGKALRIIEQKTDYKFVYSDNLFPASYRVDIDVKETPVSAILTSILTGTGFTFKMVDEDLIVITSLVTRILQRDITGVVSSTAGDLLEGVTVTVEKGGVSATTNSRGEFSVSVPDEGASLTFSYVGFLTQTIKVNSESLVRVVLQRDVKDLSDVVVVGYGSQKKSDITGAISTVDKRLLENRPVTNAVAALQGTSPGLVITRFSGQPGKEEYSAQIRGFSSINGTNTALTLIDGVEGDLTLLNPNDIESVSVLKDAAAASIYGAKAAGGVIIVTTKKGATEKLNLTYSGLTSLNRAFGIPKRIHSWEEAKMQNEAFVNAGSSPAYRAEEIEWLQDPNVEYVVNPNNPRVYNYYYDLNQIDVLMRKTSLSQNHNLSLRGGSDKTQYLLSLGYYDQHGVFKFGPDGARRYNARLNLNTRFNKTFSLDSRISYVNSKTMSPAGDTYQDYGLIYGIYQLRTRYPIFLPGSDSTKYARNGSGPTTYNILKDGGYGKQLQHNLEGVFSLKAANIVKGLSLNLVYSPQLAITALDYFEKTIPLYDIGPDPTKFLFQPNSIRKNRSMQTRTNLQALADYDLMVGSHHHFHLLGGYQYQDYRIESTNAIASALITNDVPSLNLSGDPTVPPYVSDDIQANALISYFGRFNYNYDGKYFLEATLRNDASSQLSPGRRSQYFPSISAAWKLDRESWFESAFGFFNEFKLRGSWGKLGNSNVLGNYDYISMLTRGPAYPFNNTRNNSLYQSVLASPEKTWETIETSDVGIDVGLLNGRLSFNFDYYIRTNNNMLVVLNAPATLGILPSATNSAKLRTKGWEGNLGWKDRLSSFNYWINFNISDNTNEVLRYDGQNVIGEGLNRVIEGMPLNSLYGYQSTGYFQSAEDVSGHAFQDDRSGPGDLKYTDQDKNGKIDGGLNRPDNHGDLVYMGNTSPRYTFGTSLGFEWKGFDFSALLQGVGKRNMLIYSYAIVPFVDAWRQPWAINQDYWTPENTNALFPRLYLNGTQNTYASTKWVQNAAYIRLKNLQVGYTLPQSLTSRVKMQKVRVFFSGQDIWENSKMWYKYFDAESPNDAAFNYPFFRSFAFGLTVTF